MALLLLEKNTGIVINKKMTLDATGNTVLDLYLEPNLTPHGNNTPTVVCPLTLNGAVNVNPGSELEHSSHSVISNSAPCSRN